MAPQLPLPAPLVPLLKPRPLLPGGTIAVVSLSKWAEPDQLKRAGEVLKAAGYRLVWGESNDAREHQSAGPPELRARELERFFTDPQVDAIFCARGGYAAFRVEDILDYGLIPSHPKIFMGFSDLTTLLLSITQATGLVTFHGPMLYTFFHGPEPLSFEHMQGVLSGEQRETILSASTGVKVLRAGTGRGALWGGNLFLFLTRLSTSRQLDTRGNILFLEDTNEPLHKIESMFQQLRRSGMLAVIAGLIVGEFTAIPREDVPFGKTVDDIVLEACEGLDIPIVTGVPCGHGSSILTFPLSLPAELRTADGQATLSFQESPVEG